MAAIEMVRTFVEYHVDMTRRVWGSIDKLDEPQFVADDGYSRGSIRNLMVHLSHTDLRWLTGLKNQPDPGRSMKPYEAYPDRASVREYWESVAAQLTKYVNDLDEERCIRTRMTSPGRVGRCCCISSTTARTTARPYCRGCRTARPRPSTRTSSYGSRRRTPNV